MSQNSQKIKKYHKCTFTMKEAKKDFSWLQNKNKNAQKSEVFSRTQKKFYKELKMMSIMILNSSRQAIMKLNPEKESKYFQILYYCQDLIKLKPPFIVLTYMEQEICQIQKDTQNYKVSQPSLNKNTKINPHSMEILHHM